MNIPGGQNSMGKNMKKRASESFAWENDFYLKCMG